jgi:hypothetical protein
MCANSLELNAERSSQVTSGWRELRLEEDWWAIWLGLGIVVANHTEAL